MDIRTVHRTPNANGSCFLFSTGSGLAFAQLSLGRSSHMELNWDLQTATAKLSSSARVHGTRMHLLPKNPTVAVKAARAVQNACSSRETTG